VNHDEDPVAHAATKVMTWSSIVATAAEALAQVAERRARERAEQNMWRATQLRAERQAHYARDRLLWEPVLDPGRLVECGVREAGLAWAASQAWHGDPEADVARDTALDRLRELRPDVMRVYDHLTGEEGLDPIVAMQRVAPLMDRPPAWTAEPVVVKQPELGMPLSASQVALVAYGDRPGAQQFPPPDVGRDRLLSVVSAAERYFGERLAESSHPGIGGWAGEYLRGRGLESMSDSGSPWRVGYAPPGPAHLVEHLERQGFTRREMLDAGVAYTSPRGHVIDRFRDRLMVSQRDHMGHTVGFVGRARDETKALKYLNSPEGPLYHKGDLWFGLAERAQAVRDGAQPVIVEGAFDAEAVWLASEGRCVGVAPSGTAVTGRQLERLRAVTDKPLVVALDGDNAGQTAARRVFEHAPSAQAVVLPEGRDPASMWQDGDAAELRFMLARPLPLADLVVDAKLDGFRLDDISGRVNAKNAVVPTIAGLPAKDVGRQVARVADRLGLDVMAVSADVLDHISKPAAEPARHPAAARERSPVLSR